MTSFFSTKYYFLCFFTGIQVKTHFPLKAQSLINFKSSLIILAEVVTSWATENKEVPSANNLHLFLRPFGKSLTYVKSKRSLRMKPCDTSARISTQDEHRPFKTTLCFLLVKKSFINQVSTYTVLTLFVNQSSMTGFIKSFLRYLGITLERQGLYWKHF